MVAKGMSHAPADLSDDPAALKAMIAALQAENGRMSATLRAHDLLIQSLRLRIANRIGVLTHLVATIHQVPHKLFRIVHGFDHRYGLLHQPTIASALRLERCATCPCGGASVAKGGKRAFTQQSLYRGIGAAIATGRMWPDNIARCTGLDVHGQPLAVSTPEQISTTWPEQRYTSLV